MLCYPYSESPLNFPYDLPTTTDKLNPAFPSPLSPLAQRPEYRKARAKPENNWPIMTSGVCNTHKIYYIYWRHKKAYNYLTKC